MKIDENFLEVQYAIILFSTRTNSSSLIIQPKLVNKTRNQTLNDSPVPAVANDSGKLEKGNFSFIRVKRTVTEKLMNNWDVFSNSVNGKLKVDETFITDSLNVRKRKKSYAEAVRFDTTDFPKIYCELLSCEKSISSNLGTCPPDLCINLAEVSNSSNSQISQNDANAFSSQGEELLSILQDLQQNSSYETNKSCKRIGGYFCSDTVFDLRLKLLTDAEKKKSRERARFCPYSK